MNTSIIWVTFILSYSILACSRREVADGTQHTSQLQWRVDTLDLIPPKGQLVDSYVHPKVFQEDGKPYLAMYNFATYRIEAFNLADKTRTLTVPLHDQARTSIDPSTQSRDVSHPRDFYPISSDSILVFSVYQAYLINGKGQVYKQIELRGTNLDSTVASAYHINPPIRSSQYYDRSSNIAYLRVFNRFLAPQEGPYKQSIIAALDLMKGTIDTLPIRVPKFFIKSDALYDYNSLFPEMLTADRRLIYNFPVSSSIFLYDLESGKTTEIKANSKHTANEGKPIPIHVKHNDVEARFKQLSRDVNFFAPLHDPYRNLYYRVHRGERPELLEEQTPPHFYLTVFDSNWNILEEIPMGATKFFTPCVAPDGLLLLPAPQTYTSRLPLVRFVFDRH